MTYQAIINNARQKITFSPNNPNRNNEWVRKWCVVRNFDPSLVGSLDELPVDIKVYFQLLRNNKVDAHHNMHQLMHKFGNFQPKQNPFLTMLQEAQIVRAYGFGNCDELAQEIFYDAVVNRLALKVDQFALPKHVFIVVDRKPESLIEDWKSWKAKALDAWTNFESCFETDEMPLYLKNFIEFDNDSFSAKIEPFDPFHHKIGHYMANIFTFNDLKLQLDLNKDLEAITWLQSNLDHFHSLASFQERETAAKDLLDKMPKMKDSQNKHVISILKSQLQVFLDPTYVKVFQIGPDRISKNFLFKNIELMPEWHEDFVSALMIKKLAKIVKLFEDKKDSAAYMEFYSLNEALQNSIYRLELKNKDATLEQIIKLWVADKVTTALKNGRNIEAKQITQLMPKVLFLLPPDQMSFVFKLKLPLNP